jgi:hypothetical protein
VGDDELLYVGTWQYGDGGQLYEVNVAEVME